MKRFLVCLILVILMITMITGSVGGIVSGITNNKSAETELPQFSVIIILQVDNPYIIVNDIPFEIDPGKETKPIIKAYDFFWGYTMHESGEPGTPGYRFWYTLEPCKDDRVLVPIRAIIEALGGSIFWDAREKKVTIIFEDRIIESWIGNSIAKVDDIDTPIDPDNSKVIPEIINTRTMLPLEFVAKVLSKYEVCIHYKELEQTVMISYTYPVN